MFPLGTVLVPTALLPLHVFEPRYRALVDDVLASDARELGVVLIERGHEVGGGDVRTSVGTAGRVLDAERTADGRWGLVVVGTRRIRIEEWLDDDPYPRARVVDWPDEGADVPPEQRDEAVGLLRRALALAAELGEARAPATIDLAEDPVDASFQITAVAPLGPADRQALLATPDVASRLERAGGLLAEAIEVMEARLALPGDEPPAGR